MSNLTGDERARYVRNIFQNISPHYDRMNRLMTAGQDVAWRREVIRRADPRPGMRLLDLGAGTGDLAREALRRQPGARVVAADFTLEMMLQGKGRGPHEWCAADALCLPFADQAFDVVVSGFLLRNVGDLDQALREQFRVLRPGGRIVILETTRPRENWLAPILRFYMNQIIPQVGGMISGSRMAYAYLPDSSLHFLTAEDLSARMAAAGFRDVGFRRRMLGTVAIHWGRR
jgi:demethylmenaquinone methyltransferase/2-methoxy-6-polyprenyl-1,4-benzoquinol methylase